MTNFLLAMHLLAQAHACTDFSGTYVIQGEDGRVTVQIRQTGCARIAISWESSLYPNNPPLVHSLRLDGILRPDRIWFGRGMQQTAALLRSNQLEVFQAPPSPSRDVPRSLMLRLHKLSDGDLCVFDPSAHGNSPPTRASRQRAPGRKGHDDAASRSSAGCDVP